MQWWSMAITKFAGSWPGLPFMETASLVVGITLDSIRWKPCAQCNLFTTFVWQFYLVCFWLKFINLSLQKYPKSSPKLSFQAKIYSQTYFWEVTKDDPKPILLSYVSLEPSPWKSNSPLAFFSYLLNILYSVCIFI